MGSSDYTINSIWLSEQQAHNCVTLVISTKGILLLCSRKWAKTTWARHSSRAYERGVRGVHFTWARWVQGHGRMKGPTLRISVVKPKLMVAFSICSAGSLTRSPHKPSEIISWNENLPKLLASLFVLVVIFLYVAMICDYYLIHIK